MTGFKYILSFNPYKTSYCFRRRIAGINVYPHHEPTILNALLLKWESRLFEHLINVNIRVYTAYFL